MEEGIKKGYLTLKTQVLLMHSQEEGTQL